MHTVDLYKYNLKKVGNTDNGGDLEPGQSQYVSNDICSISNDVETNFQFFFFKKLGTLTIWTQYHT